MAVFFVRLLVFLLGAAAIALAAVPLLVLVDLVGGGSGYGLCPNGLEACDKPYTTAAEFMVILTIGLGLAVLAIRLLMRLVRRLQDDSYQATQ